MAGCDTIIIFTTRMQELADFYRKGLGLPVPQDHGENHLGFQLDNLYFGFDQVDGQTPSGGGVTLWFSVPDLDIAFDRFVGLGAGVRYPPP